MSNQTEAAMQMFGLVWGAGAFVVMIVIGVIAFVGSAIKRWEDEESDGIANQWPSLAMAGFFIGIVWPLAILIAALVGLHWLLRKLTGGPR